VAKTKAFNMMLDTEGSDIFIGGDYAYNWMYAYDTGLGNGLVGPGADDLVVPGVKGSYDVWYVNPKVDAGPEGILHIGDQVWDNGYYPGKPPC
jgi:hypothetical protein